MLLKFILQVVKKTTRWSRKYRWKSQPPEKIFTEIYANCIWKNEESASGPGSDLKYSKQLIFFLPRIIKSLNIHSIVDLACGDFNWLKEVDLSGCSYRGYDIVPEIIHQNTKLYGGAQKQFHTLNVIEGEIPTADLIICRDLFVHLNNLQINTIVDKLKTSGATYLLSTTFHAVKNHDIVTGTWRALDLQSAPFNLPVPLLLLNEYPFLEEPGIQSRFIGLWNLNDIR